MKLQKLMKILKNENRAIDFLIDEGILKKEKKCYKCKKIMKFHPKEKRFYCPKKSCNRRVSIYEKTFFESSKIKINKLLLLCYMYLVCDCSVNGIKMSLGCSSKTISRWLEYLRQLVGESVPEEKMTIGGPGITVEIDETKLGKRKYHRGHRVEGVWVVAGVERTQEKKMFAINVENRNEETLQNVIERYVLPGSIICTDGWKAYKNACLNNNFEHQVVNHSKFFKDPDTGVHTNTIEGNNNALKYVIKPRNRNKKSIKYHLLYFLWRRINKKDLWGGFLKALKEIRYK